ncbi:hypothetical protein [Thalassococcus sp. S3]|uniref:hypothetical protein n=1 Tax=Thalassococcus sp. S3 TaxID=2017482 RepID=UPI0010243E5A|nr:hypothetical protein [Thalassococcus sp. S3]QBF33389.1 hypothetical protein CFI11_19555 [Thalassococcus sp. S3]
MSTTTTIDRNQPTPPTFAPDQADPVSNPQKFARADKVARTQDAGDVIREIVTPDAIVFGETHAPPGLPQVAGGNFLLVNTKTGQPSYFGARPVTKLPSVFLPGGGEIKSAISVVGTANNQNDEGGVGVTAVIPTPIGKLLLFANARQDGLTAGNLLEKIQGRDGDGTFTMSVNMGVAYSVSDGVTIGSAGLNPAFSQGARAIAAATGGNLWAGIGYRGQVTFKDGQIASMKIGGVDVPVDKLGDFFGRQVEAQRQSPTLPPNFGNNAIASLNDTTLAIYGQSPWQIGASAATFGTNGVYDVRNHGNPVTSITEPIYELGVREGVITPGQVIRSNEEAGQTIDAILNRIADRDGAGSQAYSDAIERLSNKYDLTFGSFALEALSLPTLGERPADYDFVRSVFAGAYRREHMSTPR